MDETDEAKPSVRRFHNVYCDTLPLPSGKGKYTDMREWCEYKKAIDKTGTIYNMGSDKICEGGSDLDIIL